MHVVENGEARQPRTRGVRASGSQHPSAPLRSVLASPFDRWGSVLHRGTDAMEHAPPAGRRTSPPLRLPLCAAAGRTVAARRSRARAASRVAKRVRTGRAVEGGARGSNGGDGACARRGGAGTFPATLARGLPLALLEAGSYLRAELQPRTLRGFRRFDFAFRLPFFRPWGTVQRGWCVFAFDARAACARVCVHDGASSLSRHLLSFGRFMRSSRRARPRRGARAHIPREPRHASVVTSVVTSVARVLGALSASARLRLS